ncbi:hypothetical protein AYO21_00853 [Fonsecaea monophora]|uniref:Uncharacterized protein n=1 Tax=Fonsecaea monophora TaxID=254056 RepID=A0A177FM71_9EURO|nr:hypothetical protein AYO21_00853 [Fonsecaea monophora]KAH0844385.1 hypothetical protein FOPE_09934 [Fonsecaea pedrosoi]OAG44891.1 hypothetical protein AYO21_00853 [Fonsecaea monophora]
MDTPGIPAENRESILKDDGEQQQQQQQREYPFENRENVMIVNSVGRWQPLLASVDCDLPRHRIDLGTLRRVYDQQVTFTPDEHSHPGFPGSCIGTITLRCNSTDSPDGFKGEFCIVSSDDRGVILTRSLRQRPGQNAILPVANQSDLSTKEKQRQKEEAKKEAKRREKEKSKKKEEDRHEKDKEIRGESSK